MTNWLRRGLCIAVVFIFVSVDALQPLPAAFRSSYFGSRVFRTKAINFSAGRKCITEQKDETATAGIETLRIAVRKKSRKWDHGHAKPSPLAFLAAILSTITLPEIVIADDMMKQSMDPTSFQPVCPTSDGIYRFLQASTVKIVGVDSFVEYGPLIAGGLLRVRLEFCVVESFFNEAVGPFIAKNGLNWILPLHETVETFLAGTVFAFAATFILLGSTKLVTVAITYTDFLFGVPSRLFGGFFYDRALGKPVTLDVGLGPFKTRLVGPPEEEEEVEVNILERGPVNIVVIILSGAVKLLGQFLRILREFFDAIDIFVGRYLVVWATGYVLIKFLHYKVFPDFPF